MRRGEYKNKNGNFKTPVGSLSRRGVLTPVIQSFRCVQCRLEIRESEGSNSDVKGSYDINPEKEIKGPVQ